MKKLKIGQIAPLNLPVPPIKYGGTELVVSDLTNGLAKKGHDVYLFASKDSKTNAKLIPITEKHLWDSKVKDTSPYYGYQIATIAKKAKELKIDILHDHMGPWSLPLYSLGIPIVHTIHVPTNKDRAFIYKKMNSKIISISNNQRKPAPDLNYLATVYNGINLDDFPFNNNPKKHFIWVGELSPRKGILEVIEIAKLTKINLLIIGRIPPPSQKKDYSFFKKNIEKELNKKNITYIGEIKKKTLGKYYKNARAFIYPLQWEEPFGLIMAESMACGTPVIAFNRGSVPEVVAHNKTGFVVKTTKEMLKAIKKNRSN